MKIKLDLKTRMISPGCYSSSTDTIYVYLNQLYKRRARYKSHKLYGKPISSRFNEVVSHESVHAAIEKVAGSYASHMWDNIVPLMWYKGISIDTNRKW